VVIHDRRYRSFAAVLGDEAESVITLDLVKRALTFDPSKGVKFATYAYPSLSQSLIRASLRAQRETTKDPATFEDTVTTTTEPEQQRIPPRLLLEPAGADYLRSEYVRRRRQHV